MSPLIPYLTKVSLLYLLFFVVYWLLFRKETFFVRNRIFLLISIIAPALIPLIQIPVTTPMADVVSGGGFAKILVLANVLGQNYGSENQLGHSVSPVSQYPSLLGAEWRPRLVGEVFQSPIDFGSLLVWLYLAGVVVFLIRMLWSYADIIRLIWRSERQRIQDMILVISRRKVSPFSIFRWLVIPGSRRNHPDLATILYHEMIHFRQRHSLDLLLAELLIVFQWFNPIAWVLKSLIVRNNEYYVDRKLLSDKTDIRSYQYALLASSVGERRIAMVNRFNQGLIKKRIEMMNKKDTRLINRIKDLLIVPFAILIIVGFSAYSYTPSEPVPNAASAILSSELPTPDYQNRKVVKSDSTIRIAFYVKGQEITVKDMKGYKKGEDYYIAIVDDSVEIRIIIGKDSIYKVIKIENDGTKNALVAFKRRGVNDEDKEVYVGRVIIDSTSVDQDYVVLKHGGDKVHFYTKTGKPGYLFLSNKDGKGFDVSFEHEGNGKDMLLVVDEKEYSDNEWPIPDSKNIQSISILNEKEGLEKYGEKAKNGAIVITTRKK